MSEIFAAPESISKNAHITSMAEYTQLYERSIQDPIGFWKEQAEKEVEWFHPFSTVLSGSFERGNITWFLNGKLNVSFNCVDKWAALQPEKVAIICEGDDTNHSIKVTYGELLDQVCRMANLLKSLGVRKGDVVCIYLPNTPEAAIAMLACARIGAPHSVVFAGFSAHALHERILDANCKLVITADEGLRGRKTIPLKRTVEEAILGTKVEHLIVLRHTKNPAVQMHPTRDIDLHEALKSQRPYCPCEWLDSEDILFLLYTSGSTGKPKGVAHTQAGYLLYTKLTHKYVFDVHADDIYACMADVGWITGHSYIVYGPLANGATTFMFESLPTYPNAGRYWDMVERHKITLFYTAPTAIRLLMKSGTEPVKAHDRSSLRILGSVGEPINPEAWKWYYDVVGEKRCAIVDTFWQTETGGITITPLPGATPTKPGSATFPFFGIQPAVLDPSTGAELQGNGVSGVLAFKFPWPSITRTVYGDHERYMSQYLNPYKGYYFTGDGTIRDSDGYYWITGRVDDVINVSGHRLGTAEIESALVSHPSCAEAACVGYPHDLKG
eukprot:TRINITY_DN509_c0_g1_i1.p1 TRINITY_DN509_c0_g1~~TRINITY_DN509_c0_g1_i1.p1  ORF type:complete len:555 (-),score=109.18 TRINITY_DN509_c0_g1_i1:508-2172(-)